MTQLTLQLDDPNFKEVVKEALAELLQERRELFQPMIDEALEDMAMSAAIREGLESDKVSREDVMAALRT